MNKLKIVSVGKIKTPFWQEAARHYSERLMRGMRLEHIEVKDGLASLPVGKRISQEAERLTQALIPSDYIIVMDEHGEFLDSVAFADMLKKVWDSSSTPCFVIGGAYGHDAELKQKAKRLISLSPMTFPHEMAKVVLLEQLFRADAIMRGTGYHHC